MDLEQQKKAERISNEIKILKIKKILETLEALENDNIFNKNMIKKQKLNYQELLEELEQKPKFNETWNPKYKEIFYFVNSIGEVCDNTLDYYETAYYTYGNCFKTYEQAEQRAKEIKVYNLLKNFSDANGGDKIDFDYKVYFLEFNELLNEWVITSDACISKKLGTIYFKSKEVADEALRRYRK